MSRDDTLRAMCYTVMNVSPDPKVRLSLAVAVMLSVMSTLCFSFLK